MYTADPGPITGISIIDPTLSMVVLILGLFFIILGTVIAGVVYRESREWKKLVMPLFDRDSTETTSKSPEEPGRLTPRTAALGKEICSRVFAHMDVAGLLGGAAIVILGILVVLIGLAVGS